MPNHTKLNKSVQYKDQNRQFNNRYFSKFSMATLITSIISVYGTCAKVIMAAYSWLMKDSSEDAPKRKIWQVFTFEMLAQHDAHVGYNAGASVYFEV